MLLCLPAPVAKKKKGGLRVRAYISSDIITFLPLCSVSYNLVHEALGSSEPIYAHTR